MCCRIADLRDKQVLNIKDGSVIGFVNDMEVDTCNGRLVSIVVSCRGRGFSLFSRDEEVIIPWERISVIGNDSILVTYEESYHPTKRKSSLSKYFLGD